MIPAFAIAAVLAAPPGAAAATSPAPSAAPAPAAPAPATPAPTASTPAAPAPLRARLVFVAGFENASEDRSLYWLGEAISDGLSRAVKACGGEAVDRTDRFALREEMGVPTLSSLTLATQIRTAEELGAGTLVTGDFTANGETLIVRARVVDVVAGRTGPWIAVDGSVKAVLPLQDDLFNRLHTSLPVSKTCGPFITAEDGVPQASYEMLLKSFLEDAPDKREKLLRRSLDLSSDYLRAKIELAMLYRELNQLPKASTVLANVATRDPGLAAEAHNLLGENELDLEHTTTAESSLRRSLMLRETARAHLLLAKIAIARGDTATAASELARSRAMDPSDPELVELEESLRKPR